MYRILPILLLAFCFVSPLQAQKKATGFALVAGEGYSDLVLNSPEGPRPIWRHMTAYDPADRDTTYKTYHHVFGFGPDAGFITKGAGGKFTHHRGLYIGWSKTKAKAGSADFWHVKGKQDQSVRFIKYLEQKHEAKSSMVSAEIHWILDDGTPVVKEIRDITTRLRDDGGVEMDWSFTLSGVDGDVELNGDPQHAGFQFRAVNEVTATKAAYLRDATASGGKGDVWKTCNWVANTFKAGDKDYCVVHMNHPKNPGDTVYSTRDYGRFGAYAPHTIKAGESLKLNYRVLVLDATPSAEACQKAFDAFVGE